MKTGNKKLSIYSVIIAAVLLCSVSFAQENKPDAEFQKIVKEYTLHKDGSVTFHYAHSLMLYSYYSFTTAYGETHIVYNTKFQKVKVNIARTTMSDGNQINSPQNAFNEILPGFVANAPAYNHIRDLVVTHTGLERNALIDVDYEINSQPGFYPELMGNECLKTSSPVKEFIIKVTVPTNPDRILQYKLLNYSGDPIVTNDSSTTTYTWTFKDLPALSVEKFKPALSETEPTLLFSSSPNFQKLYLKFVNRSFLGFQTDEKLKKYVLSVKEKTRSELEFILKVQDIVANQVKTYNIPLNYTGYDPQTPLQVFYANGGTPIEKAALMVSMLNIGGIKAFPEWVGPRALVLKEIGNLNVFDEVYVRVYNDPQKYIHLPVSQHVKNNMNMYSDNKTFVLIDPETKYANMLPVPATQPQTYDYKIDMSFEKPDSYTGKVLAAYLQGANAYYDVFTDSTEVIGRLLQNVIVPKDAVKKADLVSPALSNFTFDIASSSKSFLNEKNYWFLTLPRSNDAFDAWQLTALPDGRKTPVQLPSAINETYTYSISLPKNYEVAGLPLSKKIVNAVGAANIEIRQDKKKIVLFRSLTIAKSYIPVEEYKLLQELVNTWRAETNKPLIYKTAE